MKACIQKRRLGLGQDRPAAAPCAEARGCAATPWTTILVLVLLSSLMGCRHRVTLVSDPLGAAVSHGRTTLGTTPTEVVLWKAPFLRYRVRVGHSGYRAVEVDLARGLRPWRARRQHEVILVREHGPSGTWDAEQAGD